MTDEPPSRNLPGSLPIWMNAFSAAMVLVPPVSSSTPSTSRGQLRHRGGPVGLGQRAPSVRAVTSPPSEVNSLTKPAACVYG